MESYEKKHYDITMTEHPDSLTVRKTPGSDWCRVHMTTHGDSDGTITIRSRAMAEALRFMLEQLLRG